MNADSSAALETTKADEIRLQLEELIVAGRLRPGEVLRQDELATRFAVSRTPIREALRQLSAIGLVTFTPNRGVRVRALDRNEWAQTYRARAALEGATAEAAAERITDEALARLDAADRTFQQQIDLLRRRDLSRAERSRAAVAWVRANDEFHDIIIDASGLDVLARHIVGLRRSFSGEASWAEGSAADALYHANVCQHAALRAALRARNPRAAKELMEAHILDSWVRLEAVVEESEGGDVDAADFSSADLPAV